MDYTLKWSNYTLELHKRTHIMWILNVTPDSFSDGGHYFKREKAIEHGLEMASNGADIIDVGGESTRPYAEKISIGEEIDRVIPVIEALRREISVPISIDSYKSDVVKEALNAGASIINDVSALRFDPFMAKTAAEAGVPVVVMHMKGTPENMQDNPCYEDLISEIRDFLEDAVDRAVMAGIREEMVIIDPGIGFGKTFDDNLKIIRDLSEFSSIQKPLMLGPSNKAFIGHILNKEPQERDTGSMAAVAYGVINGAHIVRVHNVEKTLETVTMIEAIKRGRNK